jgi:hypothetical protein
MNFDDVPEKMLNVDYLRFEVSGKLIYVMLNHRVAYLCWMDALRKGYISKGAFLCHIDLHPDFNSPPKTILEEDARIQDNQVEELEEFVKNKLNAGNADFIIPALERQLVGDVLSIHKDEGTLGGRIKGNPLNQTTDRIEYPDKKKNLHIFYFGGSSFKELFEPNGLLVNSANQDAQKAFGVGVNQKNFILDIDLDYFGLEESDGWLTDEQSNDLTDSILQSMSFRNLLDCSRVITIALEPFWSGGKQECLRILERLCLTLKKHLGIDIEKQVLEKFSEHLST